ncbi:MAG: hypothetical protein L0207_02250 [Chlamydiae bacterium]|nr:hypothetical protein [Chlamydiota bacterium]
MKYPLLLLLFIFSFFEVRGNEVEKNLSFHLVFLGIQKEESSVSGLLVAPFGSSNYVSIDGGFLFSHPKEILFFKEHVKAYLLSHSYLSHFANLALQAPHDSNKNIYALEEIIVAIRDHIFNWTVWPNYGDEGKLPHLSRYHYVRLPLEKRLQIPKTSLDLETFTLSHLSSLSSTIFILSNEEDQFVYIGTGLSRKNRDEIEKVWNRIAPAIRQKKCKALYFAESDQVNNVQASLDLLAEIVDEQKKESALSDVKIILNLPMHEEIQSNHGEKFLFSKPGSELFF